MLVLERVVNQGVTISGPCHVVVISVKGERVRLGFEADRAVAIHRDEVAARIREEEKAK
jgi:carbon storage regulator